MRHLTLRRIIYTNLHKKRLEVLGNQLAAKESEHASLPRMQSIAEDPGNYSQFTDKERIVS